jgi:hypothetical protein
MKMKFYRITLDPDRIKVTGFAFVAMIALSVNICLAQVSFESNKQQINNFIGRGIQLSDFNGDDVLDAFVVNEDDYRVYFGEGDGKFTDSGQRLTKDANAFGEPAVGDIDGDGNLEIITGSTVWVKDKKGIFSAEKLRIESPEICVLEIIRLADLNGDGSLDIFAILGYSASRVYLNDGHGNFRDTGQRLGDGTIGKGQIAKIALGDINNDSFIDAVTAGWRWNGSTQCPNHVWINDGTGIFHDSGQLLDEGGSHVHGLSLGDLNSDGWLDLIMGLQDVKRSGKIFLNDGKGLFMPGIDLNGAGGEEVAIGDFDNNGTPDIFAAHSTPPNMVWLNNGKGIFSDSDVRLGSNCSWDVAAGDFNSDGKLDAFVVGSLWGTNRLSPAPAQIWLNTTISKVINK